MGYGTTRPVCRTNWYKDFSIGTVKSSWVEDTGSVFVSLCKSEFGNMKLKICILDWKLWNVNFKYSSHLKK